MQITFVTGNKNKVKESEKILNRELEISEIELDEIQELDLEKVALHKLNQAYEILQKPVMIDDVSFEIHAWNSFPGPLIKWILKAGEGSSLLLKLMENENDRRVTVRLAIGFHDGKSPHLFFGVVHGTIAHSIQGENGFGWDKVFVPEGYEQTFAQMPPELKNSISHRGLALKKLSDFLIS